MTVTRDVVRDLLPAYLAGEASADTRRIVEAFLASDPALAREVEAGRGQITFLLLRDRPDVAYAWWATAAIMWVSHFIIRRRTRVSGL